MSASRKKMLRNAEEAAKMTEKQLAEQKEAKKLKIFSTVCVVVLALIVVAALYIGITQTVSNSGIMQRNTTAMTVGEHKISSAELNYFYIDAVNQFYGNYGEYAAMFGLDATKPLNAQVSNQETGATWADDFLLTARDNAKAVYALADEATANGFTLPESAKVSVDNSIANMELYATYYGYTDTEAYLKALYGSGSTMESFRAYCELTYLAESYRNEYAASLTYDDAALRAAEAENFDLYSTFTYNSYYLNASKFLTGGTTDDEGNTTYSDEEKAAAVAAAEAAAVALTDISVLDTEALDAAIAALEINAEVENAGSTHCAGYSYDAIGSVIRDWIVDDSRQYNDRTYIANTTTDADGNETVNGYYVLFYGSSDDNGFALANVRHCLVAFEGGTYDSTTGTTVYSDEEKAAARKAADDLYAQWKAGEATEESFAALANEHSDDGDGTTGGLFENVYPGQMVTNFNDWCFDESRTAGDTGIVESEYGYHIMFYSGDSATTYRDYLIENDLREADYTAWYNELVAAMPASEEVISKYAPMDLVLSNG